MKVWWFDASVWVEVTYSFIEVTHARPVLWSNLRLSLCFELIFFDVKFIFATLTLPFRWCTNSPLPGSGWIVDLFRSISTLSLARNERTDLFDGGWFTYEQHLWTKSIWTLKNNQFHQKIISVWRTSMVTISSITCIIIMNYWFSF